VKDANGSHFELLLGEADWGRCTHVDSDGVERTLAHSWATVAGRDQLPLAFDAASGALSLAGRISRFRAAPSDMPPDPAVRLGAAMDAYGSVYWVADGGARIDVFSSGSRSVSLFASANPAPVQPPTVQGGFAPRVQPKVSNRKLRGLAVTGEGYLVAGCSGGLLVFDLLAGGPALELAWPMVWPFNPHALAARPCGGVAVLDRTLGRVWMLDRRLGMHAVFPVEPELPSAFATDPTPTPASRPWFDLQVDAMGGADPVALVVLADDAVLVMDGAGAGSDQFALVTLYVDGVLVARQSTRVVRDLIDASDRADFVLRGFDCALAARPDPQPQRLVIAAQDGNQCFAFDLWRGSPALTLDPIDSFLPMRRFGGRGLVQRTAHAADIAVAQDSGLVYDGAGTWLPLVAQSRPRYESSATFSTPALDSDLPDCTWHRLVFDGCIPPGCSIHIESRAADSLQALGDQRYSKEPNPVLRPEGSELPWLRDGPGTVTDLAAGRGSWELLFQQARGRYLQLRLTFASQELGTPRLLALRAWSPRFSYLREYLPALYREEESSAEFLDRFLANFEGLFTHLEDRIVAATALFDVRTAPDATLDWLGSWLGLVLDPAVNAARKRLLIRFAVPLFAYRGTTQGLRLATELVLSECVKPDDFALPSGSQNQPYGIRIVERFLTRRLPPDLLGETVIDAPRWVVPAQRWSPAEGAEGLQQRFDAARLKAGLGVAPFRPTPPTANTDVWSAFCQAELGAVPQLAGALRSAWQNQLATLGNPAGLGPDLPGAWPAEAGKQSVWQSFLADGLAPELKRWLTRWQSFIARRYQRVSNALFIATWGPWPAFDLLPAPDQLPRNTAALTDWTLFETRLETMALNAHRFSVLLPSSGPLADAQALARQVDFAQRVVNLEKPAHTTFDVRPYWAMFRIGQARAGLDTLLGIGSRAPELAPQWVIGSGHVGASRVAFGQRPPRDRLLLTI
jgi:phage tail-like protein